MKIKMFFLIACLASLSLPAAWAQGTGSGGGFGNSMHSDKGGLPTLQSSVSTVQNQSGITVQFKSDLGSVNVAIKDSKGNTVYFESVDTSSNKQLYINTLGFTKGSYTISVIQNNRSIFSQVLGIN